MLLKRPALILLISMFAIALNATAQSADVAPPGLTGSVRDESGAVMQAVTVRAFRGDATEPVAETVSDEQGFFRLELPPGEYRVEVSAPEFKTVTRAVQLTSNTPPLPVVLAIQEIEQIVDVSATSERVVADTTMSLTSVTLSGDELLDLPDNEEDLATYLQMLAGMDTTGDLEEDVLANFIIDGFNRGRLPRPDEIAQIIIDPSSLSADGNGPRIEIITKPGTGRWRRSLNFGFADESLNALTPGETGKPARQTRDVDFDMSGPVIPNFMELDFEASTRNDERAGNSLRATSPGGNLFEGVVRPTIEREFEIETEFALSAGNTLETGFGYTTRRSENNGVGGFTLPERGSDDRGRDWSFHVSNRRFGDGFTNDFQIELSRESSWETPVSEGFAIDVADAFNSGGGTDRSSERETSLQLENRLRLERGPWNFQIGGEFRYDRSMSVSEENYNGTFDFSSLHDYCYAAGFPGINCQTTRRIVEAAQAAGLPPMYEDARGQQTEITGIPATFSQASGNARFDFSEIGFNAYFQADRQFGEKASLRTGLRYEATNHSIDYLRINPTVNFQYRLFENTLISLGSQLNFRDFSDYERLARNDGSTYRRELSVFAPSFPNPFQSGTVEVNEQTTSLYLLDPDYQSPYNITPQFSINQQLPGGTRLTVSYSLNYGVHQQRTRNINAPFPGTPLPDEILNLPRDEQRDIVDRMRPFYPIVGNIRQIESTGRSVSRTWSVRLQPRGELRLFGLRFGGNANYNYRSGEDDNDFTNPYFREWGVSQRQHQLQSQFRIRMPDELGFSNPILRALADATYRNTNFNFNLRAESGRPYSITTGRDLNGDQSSRDRPLGVARNSEFGPGNWNLNLTFTKEFRLATGTPPEIGNLLPPQRGEGGGGFGGGGGNRGGGDNDRRGESDRDDDQPRLRFQVRVNNLLNHSQPRAYSGVLSSPFFGQPTGFTGGRTVTLGMRFDF